MKPSFPLRSFIVESLKDFALIGGVVILALVVLRVLGVI